MPPLLRLGLVVPSTTRPDATPSRLFEHVLDIAAAAETSGFDGLFALDAPGRTAGGLEAYTLLGGLAVRTRTARLGALGASIDVRGPSILVKQVTALDVLSAGRAVLGAGVTGWIGAAPGHPRQAALSERRERLTEGLEVCRALLAGTAASVDGRWFRLAGGVNHPSPLQRGGVPVMVTSVIEDDLAVVARYADACVLAGPIGHVQSMIHALGRHCAELGRDPADVTPLHTTPLVIGQSSGEIEQRLAAADQEMGAPDGQWLARAVVGRPDEVVTRLTALLDAGVQGLVVHMPGADPEAVTLAGTVLRDAFG